MIPESVLTLCQNKMKEAKIKFPETFIGEVDGRLPSTGEKAGGAIWMGEGYLLYAQWTYEGQRVIQKEVHLYQGEDGHEKLGINRNSSYDPSSMGSSFWDYL